MKISWVVGVCLCAAAALSGAAAEVRQVPGRGVTAPVVSLPAGPLVPAGVSELPEPLAALPRLSPLQVPLPEPTAQSAASPHTPEFAALHSLPDRAVRRPERRNEAFAGLESAVGPAGAAGEPSSSGQSAVRLDAAFDGSAAPVAGDSRVSLFESPLEAIDARAGLIMNAKKSVTAGYFAFFPDAAGLAKLALLRDAARRGVRVRLVLDPWGNKLSKALLRHLKDEGVEIRLYHPYRADHLSWLWRRSHDKWLVVDGEEAILGDRNMGKHYFGMGRAPWLSREAYVAGPAARQTEDYAERMWSGPEVAALKGLEKVSAFAAAKQGERLDAFAAHYQWRRSVVDYSLKPWADRARSAPAQFSYNEFSRPGRTRGTGIELLRMIREARSTIVIENAYVVLPKIFRRELARAIRDRGVRVVLVTNSHQTNNLFSVKHAYEADVPGLVAMGVELYEFRGPGTLHAKTMVVDGKRSYVGSFNLDPRSYRFNTETGVVVEGPEFAGDLLSKVEASRRNSTLVGWKNGWISPRRRWPVLSLIWGLLRRVALAALRDQV